MILGLLITPIVLLVFGSVLLVMLGTQILIGLRIIKFAPKYHLIIHKWVAYTLLAAALGHAFLGLVFALGLTIL